MRSFVSDDRGSVPFPRSLLLDPLPATSTVATSSNLPSSGQPVNRGPSPDRAPWQPLSPEPLPLNMKELERRCMGRVEFAQRLLASFETRFPIEAAEIGVCLAKRDIERLTLTVHQLKGTTANICAPILNRILKQIEDAVRGEKFVEAERLMVDLDTEWQRFAAFKSSLATSP